MMQSMIPNAIQLNHVYKTYQLYEHPLDRLKEALTGRVYHSEIKALSTIDLNIPKGQVVGLIGNNGAGKSTFLKLVTGTIQPSGGEIYTQGRIAAILELGSGFHPDMTGRENVFLSGMVMGMSKEEMDTHYDDIVAFSGIGDFIERPVKTYSSGMMMRLAFAVATSGDPDILVIDEALSVGDGVFARQSFDRIIQFRDAGKTILFCSHSLYQVEVICDRVMWLDKGQLMEDGEAADVIISYNAFLEVAEKSKQQEEKEKVDVISVGAEPSTDLTTLGAQDVQKSGQNITVPSGSANITQVRVRVDGDSGHELRLMSGESTLEITVEFVAAQDLPIPSVAIIIDDVAGNHVASAGTANEQLVLSLSAEGKGKATVSFTNIALLKGIYWVSAFLLSEDGAHLYQDVKMVTKLVVQQRGYEVGVVSLPHVWYV